MSSAGLPPDEIKRIFALKEYGILDTHPEKSFDEITQLVRMICETPVCLISLVDDCRQWFKSKSGVELESTPRDIAFCAHAILSDDIMIVGDALKDPRFLDNPLVTGAPGVRFYAGVPLRSYSGQNVGTLCVIDYQPRELSTEQIEALQILSRQVVHLFELRMIEKKEFVRERNFLASIATNMEEGAVLQDAVGAIVKCNPAALAILALTEEQLCGRTSMDPRWKSIKEDGTDYIGSEHPAMVTLATGLPQLGMRMGIAVPGGMTC